MKKTCPAGVRILREALKFAVANLEEVALPNLKKAGKVTSVPGAIAKAKAALRRTRGLCS
jgi:hypothetical protein